MQASKMTMLKKLFISTLVCGSLFITSCGSRKNNASYYSYKTHCIESNLNGTQTVEAWGKAESKTSALEQAKKNALQEIIFEGIHEGSTYCEIKPLIPEVNARKKYETYFIRFFTKDYSSFISTLDEEIDGTTSKGYLVRATLKINMADLKQRLFDDSIIR